MADLRKFRVQFLSSDDEAEDVDILTSAKCVNLTNGQTLQQFVDGGNMDGTVWIVGSVAPTNQGKEGDFYLNETTFELYRKVSEVWQLMGSIKGEKGETGETGATGEPGTPGTPGAKGADGATWLFGTAVPNAEGKKGDFYLKTDTYDIYSKATGSWVKTGNIKGAKGDKGNPGEKGETGETGATGAPGTPGTPGTPGAKGADGATWLFGTGVPSSQGKIGDFYLKTDTYDIYRKDSSGWQKTGNIKGAKGDKGEPGQKGEPGDGIRIGTSYEQGTPAKIFFKLVEG